MANETTQPSEALPKGPSEEIILKATGPVKVVRGRRGRFTNQKMPKTVDITRMVRNLMLEEDTEDGQKKILKVFSNLYENAIMSAFNPVFDKLGNLVMVDGKPLMVKDAKIAMSSAQNAKILLERAYGDVPKNEEEIEAGKTQGVKVVMIPFPEVLMNQIVKEDRPREPLRPAFIEAEGFTINEK
jgi:hypothetical protein